MSSLSCPPSPLPSLSKNQKEIIKFPDPPPSIYFGGCAFGAAFCKIYIYIFNIY